MEPSKKPKRILLVNRDFQLHYARAGFAAGLFNTALTLFCVLYPLFHFKILVVPQFLPPIFLAAILAAIGCNLLVLTFFTIFITHRVAGPMYNLVRQLRRIGAGQWRVVAGIRPKDDFRFVMRHFNEMSESLVRETETDIVKLQEIQTALESGDLGLCKQNLIALQDKLAVRINGQGEVNAP